MEIKIGCACKGCGDHRFVETGELDLLVTPEKLVDEVRFVCYRHQEEMLAEGVLSDHLALLIVIAAKVPGKALNRLGNAKQLQFLLDHQLLESRTEPVGVSKASGKDSRLLKQAYYATDTGRSMVRPFLEDDRTVTFGPYWSPYTDVPKPWWERYGTC